MELICVVLRRPLLAGGLSEQRQRYLAVDALAYCIRWLEPPINQIQLGVVAVYREDRLAIQNIRAYDRLCSLHYYFVFVVRPARRVRGRRVQPLRDKGPGGFFEAEARVLVRVDDDVLLRGDLFLGVLDNGIRGAAGDLVIQRRLALHIPD